MAKYLFTLFAVFILASAYATTASPIVNETTRMPVVQEVTSHSGITAWLVEDHSLPLLAARVVFSGAGYAHDPDNKAGRSYMTVSLLDEGAGKRDALNFTKELENNAIQIDFWLNEDVVNANLETLSEHKALAFSLLSDALIRPRFAAEDINRIRDASLVSLIQKETDPYYQLQKTNAEQLFSNHPYAKGKMGDKTSLTALKAADFQAYRQHYLTRENIQISVVGDITAEELSSLLDQHFSALPETYQPETAIPEFSWPEKGSTRYVALDIPQTMVMFSLPGVQRNDPHYFDAYVLNHILGGGSLTSMLGKEIREERGLAYGATSYFDPMLHASVLRGTFSSRNEKAEEALKVTKEVINRVLRHGVAEQELEDAREYLRGAFLLTLDTNGEVASFLATLQLYGLEKDYMQKRNAVLDAITLSSVEDAARRVLKPEQMMITLVGGVKNGGDQQ